MNFRSFIASAFLASIILGASLSTPSVAFGCGGATGGGTGCKVVGQPVSPMFHLRFLVGLFDALLP